MVIQDGDYVVIKKDANLKVFQVTLNRYILPHTWLIIHSHALYSCKSQLLLTVNDVISHTTERYKRILHRRILHFLFLWDSLRCCVELGNSTPWLMTLWGFL